MYGVFLTGGLAEEVDEKVLHAAFIPFGDLVDIQIPLDYETGETLSSVSNPDVNCTVSVRYNNVSFAPFSEKHRGFAFIEFELAEVGTEYLCTAVF